MNKFVSIHAPREGCDLSDDDFSLVEDKFQFTHPGRGATRSETFTSDLTSVSIHAPREGCDFFLPRSPRRKRSFNSRTPGGVRRLMLPKDLYPGMFQFTHPGRGATF